jgi:hypothetical protein
MVAAEEWACRQGLACVSLDTGAAKRARSRVLRHQTNLLAGF